MVSLLYYLKKSKADREGRAMIYLRITVNGKRVELSTGRKVRPNKWNSAHSAVQGFSPEIRQLNSYLAKIRTDLYKLVGKLKEEDIPLTAESL